MDQPLVGRYLAWGAAALQGDFGYSRLYVQPAVSALLPRLANTGLLMGMSFLLAFGIALAAGIAAAKRPGSRLDSLISLLSFSGISVPPFWLGLMLILVFAVTLGWLPAGGIVEVGKGGFLDRLRHLALPVATLTIVEAASQVRFVRAAMIEALRQDYIRTARAKGADEGRVLWGHALRNAMIPIVTVMALSFGGLFSGALVTETIFAYPGMVLIFLAVTFFPLILLPIQNRRINALLLVFMIAWYVTAGLNLWVLLGLAPGMPEPV